MTMPDYEMETLRCTYHLDGACLPPKPACRFCNGTGQRHRDRCRCRVRMVRLVMEVEVMRAVRSRRGDSRD